MFKLWLLYSNTWNDLTVLKEAQVRLRILLTKCLYKSWIYLIYMYKQDLVSNNLQWLICHKTKPNQTNLSMFLSEAYIRGMLVI